MNLTSPRDHCLRCKSNKQSVFDNTSDLAQVTKERLGVGNPVEQAIQQKVILLSKDNVFVRIQSAEDPDASDAFPRT